MSGYADACEAAPGGTRIRVRLVPRASGVGLAGLHGGSGTGRGGPPRPARGAAAVPAAKLRVAAPPVDGRANDEAVAWLAKALGVPRSGVTIVAGQRGRDKVVFVPGLDPTTVGRRLDAAG